MQWKPYVDDLIAIFKEYDDRIRSLEEKIGQPKRPQYVTQRRHAGPSNEKRQAEPITDNTSATDKAFASASKNLKDLYKQREI